MNRYHFITAFNGPEKNNSAFKLRFDNRDILKELGYEDCTYYFKQNRNKLLDKAGFYFSFIKLLFKKRGDVIIMQHPLASNIVFDYLLKTCKRRGIKIIAVIIDIESLRKKEKNPKEQFKEVNTLNQFSAVIVHNNNMGQWLASNGCTNPMIAIELFDYCSKTVDNTKIAISSLAGPFNYIAFAGNLQKSKFIHKLNDSTNTYFLLYGFLKKQFIPVSANVNWMGEYKPEELLNIIQAHWGLIWDGNETTFLDEGMGNYLSYNTPHKTSLYFICGLPVIVPAKSAIAPYILANRLGVVIENIEDCYNISIAANEYKTLKDNVLKVREKLLQGIFLKSALQKALASI